MQEWLDSNGEQGYVSDCENSFSEGHLRNAPLLLMWSRSRCGKSSSADRLTCKRTGGSAGSHTLTYMLHLEEMEEGEGGADDERGGRRSCSALGEREAQSSGSKGS